MRRRMIAVLLVLVLAICPTGCAKDKKTSEGIADSGSQKGKKQSEEITGRYMENEVELPKLEGNEEVIKILRNDQQQFEVYALSPQKAKYIRYIQQPDNTWKQDEPVWMNTEEIRRLVLVDICLGQDGRYYACFQSFSGSLKSVVIKVSEDEKSSEVLKIPYLDEVIYAANGKEFYPMIQKIEALKNGGVILCDMWNDHELIVISADGKNMNPIDTEQTRNFLVVGDTVYGYDKQGKIFSYDAAAEKINQTFDYEGDSSLKSYAVKEDGTILVGDSTGIHRLAPNGTLWETMVDGASNSMSMPSLTMKSMLVTEGDVNEEFYIVYQNEERGFQLKHYFFDKDVPLVPEKKITIYSLYENKTIRQAISLYQSKNTDVKIDYVVAMGEEGGNVTDYIRALNTELLSGNGADILVLDGLPAASYINKGVLADISDAIGKPYQDKTLVTNVLDHYYKDGKTFYAPVRFGVPIRIGKPEALSATETFSGLASYLDKTTEPYMPATSYEGLIRDNLAEYYDDLCVNDMIDQGKLKEFLETMKQLAVNTKSKVDLYQHMNYGDGNGNHFVISNKELFGNNSGILEECDMVTLQINNVLDIVVPNALTLNRNRKKQFDTMGQRFIPKGLVGLNKASKEKEVSKDFISFLFTSEAQDTSLNDGFPTNAASLKKWFDEEKMGFSSSISDENGRKLLASWPIKTRREVFLQAINEVNKPIEINQILFDMIVKSGVNYLSGDVDVDATTAEIMSKVNTYLAE